MNVVLRIVFIFSRMKYLKKLLIKENWKEGKWKEKCWKKREKEVLMRKMVCKLINGQIIFKNYFIDNVYIKILWRYKIEI